jgi:hypothetical protein
VEITPEAYKRIARAKKRGIKEIFRNTTSFSFLVLLLPLVPLSTAPLRSLDPTDSVMYL